MIRDEAESEIVCPVSSLVHAELCQPQEHRSCSKASTTARRVAGSFW